MECKSLCRASDLCFGDYECPKEYSATSHFREWECALTDSAGTLPWRCSVVIDASSISIPGERLAHNIGINPEIGAQNCLQATEARKNPKIGYPSLTSFVIDSKLAAKFMGRCWFEQV